MSSLDALTARLAADPASFGSAETDAALTLILRGEGVADSEIAAFLTAARETHKDRTAEFIAATVANLRAVARRIEPVPSGSGFCDIVGTGGDGRNTFNVSTTASIVAAGVPGVRVAKHGGPASTSASGASDLLSHLGVDLAKVNEHTASGLLQECEFNYLSGPVFHPTLARVRNVRRSLPFPTVFNLVGPLLNPAPVRARVLGVFTPELGRTYAEAARALFPGTPALVVCGAEGLDEISPAGPTHIWELDPSGSIREYAVAPSDFGLPLHPLSEVASGSPADNAALVHRLVDKQLAAGHPIRDYVLLNTAGLLYISGAAKSFKEGVQLAETSIDSGRAKQALQRFVDGVARLP